MRRAGDEDAGQPARMTPRRLSHELETWGVQIAALAVRGRKLGVFTPDRRVDAIAAGLIDLARQCSDVSAAVLVGASGLVDDFREVAPAAGARPLLDRLEQTAAPVSEVLARTFTELRATPDEPLIATAKPVHMNGEAIVEAAEEILGEMEPLAPDEIADRTSEVRMLCPDCGGFLDQPNTRRKPNTKLACHLGRDGKARRMRATPESVRAKREKPPEIVDAEEDDEDDRLPPRERTRRELPDFRRLLMDDPSVNDYGVWESPEEVVIDIPKSTGCSATMRLALGNDGLWREGFDITAPMPKGGHSSSPVSVRRSPEHATRISAILHLAAGIESFFMKNGHRKAAAAVKAFAERTSSEREYPTSEATSEAASDPTSHGQLVDGWQSVGIRDLELSPEVESLLEGMGYTTAGKLAHWLKQIEVEDAQGTRVLEGCNKAFRVVAVKEVHAALEGIRQPAEPDAMKPSKPALWLVLHGPDDGPFERVCLVEEPEDAPEQAIAAAKARIGWQVANFEHGLVLDGPGPDMSWRIAAAAGDGLGDRTEPAWLETPVAHERNGQSIRSNGKDLVPVECPAGEPKLYEVKYRHPHGGIGFLTTLRALDRRRASDLSREWLHGRRPTWPDFRLELHPVDEPTAARRARKRATNERAIRSEYERDDHKAQYALESKVPDPDPEPEPEPVA